MAGPVNRGSIRIVMIGCRLFGWLFTTTTFLHAMDNGLHGIDAVLDPGT